MTIKNLDTLLRPRSVAVVVDSEQPSQYAEILLANLHSGGFNGTLATVRVKQRSVLSLGARVRLSKTEGVIDLAIICCRHELLAEIIQQLGERGTRAVIIAATLHDQLNNRDLARQRKAILSAAQPYLMRILGAGSGGLLVPCIGLNASVAATPALPGKIALITQSTSIASAIVDYASSKGIGFSAVIHLGESLDIDLADALNWLAEDPETERIMVQFDSIEDGRKFISAARASARNKPVVAIRSRHTGAKRLPRQAFGVDDIYEAALRRAGWVHVASLGEAFEAMQAMARLKLLRGERLTILANGYGLGNMAADVLLRKGGRLAELDDETLKRLASLVHSKRSLHNPLELPPSLGAQGWAEALRLILADRNTHALMTVYSPSPFAASTAVAEQISLASQGTRQNIFTCWVGGESMQQAQHICDSHGLLSHESPEKAVAVFMDLLSHARNRELLMQMPPSLPEGFATDIKLARQVLSEAQELGVSQLPPRLARKLLQAFAIEAAEYRSAGSAAAAIDAANNLGYPVDLELILPGGDPLDFQSSHLHSPAEIHTAIRGLRQQARQQQPDSRISGYRLRSSAPRSGFAALSLGVHADPVFGPIIFLGPSTASESHQGQFVVGLPPLNLTLAQDMLRRSGLTANLASDVRPLLVNQISAALVRLSQLVSDIDQVESVALDPLHVETTSVIALQAHVQINQRRRRPGARRLAISPYPQELEQQLNWRGEKLLIRPIRPEDQAMLGQLLSALTAEDSRLRFFVVQRGQSRAQLARFSQIDYDREMSLVLIRHNAEGQPEALGEARLVADADNQNAEFAIVIRSDCKGQGLGKLLMLHSIDYAKNSGIGALRSETLAENKAMQHLAMQCGFVLQKGDDPGTVKLGLQLQNPEPS